MHKKAFTLIELIIVVVLIGMMAMFVIPNFSKAVNKSYAKAAYNNLLIIYSAEKLYYNNGNNNYLPSTATTWNLTQINTGLNLSIIANGITYTCTGTNGTTFSCDAAYGSTFTLRITQAGPTTSCAAGTCPTVP
jgi:prepilin-type N-terminal cleavage/methylation domain-containing protein